ncbi:MAG: hypothetical protein JSU82_08985 [Rhodospirillales bacterium]|nr:MAG: hypothetical protein JSU82_08985 [Rhodospirillales bacterium]
MSEVDRWIGVAVLGLLWLKFTAYNVFFAADRVHRRSHDGPSALPVFGSLFGIAALLLAPVASLPLRLLLVPLALAPDLAMPVAGRIVERLRRKEGPPRK